MIIKSKMNAFYLKMLIYKRRQPEDRRFKLYHSNIRHSSGKTIREVITMASYVNPRLRHQFESLSIDLKNEILSRNVHINCLNDLIYEVQDIVDKEEAAR
ncbi:MAG: hypothetical protein Q4F95_01960 [Oscillospiraceae bacterium]|nr:hypothetical protein [Oscillospiraceae bacterium]